MFTQQNPSRTYTELLFHYRSMHANGYSRVIDGQKIDVAPEKTFPGDQLPIYVNSIKEMIDATGAKTIIDYGCGKGQQYEYGPIKDTSGKIVARNIQGLWNVSNIHRYDPGVPAFDTYPSGTFDGVISTDVLEHIPREDVFWVVDEFVRMADKFIFANIACYPAMARLPDGRNAHVTVEHPRWWAGLFEAAARRKPDLKMRLVCVGTGTAPDGTPQRATVTMNLR